MPSIAVAPAQYALAGGSITTRPARVTAGRLRLVVSAGKVTAGPGTGIATKVTQPTLNRLTRSEQLTNADGTPTYRLMAIWQEAMDKIEEAFAGLTGQVTDLSMLLGQIRAAQLLAQAANDRAAGMEEQSALGDSYTDPVNVLSATSDGSVTIAPHRRRYGDKTSVAVNGGSVTGRAIGSYVTIYYLDAGRQGGAVAYQATVGAIAQEGSVHVVGGVRIPQPGSPPASGSGPTAPGFTPPGDGGAYSPDYIKP